MDVTRADVLRCAQLAHLNLDEAEIEPLRRDLAEILSHAQSLDRLDLEGVEPTTHGLDLPLPRRADEPRPGLTPDQALANAPETDRGYFVVPRVL
jgi:aspartyl-tRNA(Asn)/glutamyl-tRNA(Gln) amidotransferase subunit C